MTTEILDVTEVLSSDSDKFTIHNKGLRQIEAKLVRALSATTASPPGAPSNGDIHIITVGGAITGAWASASLQQIAHRYGGAWYFYAPKEGYRLWINDENRVRVYNGSDWNTYLLGSAIGSSAFSLTDNTADVFSIKEGSNEYFMISTTNGSELIEIAPNGAAFSIGGVTTHSENVSITKSTNGALKLDLVNVNTGAAANTQVRFTNDNANYASINLTGINYTGVASWQDAWVWYTDSGIAGGLKLSIDTGGFKVSTSGLETSDFVVDDNGAVGIGTSAPTAGFKQEIIGDARIADAVGDSGIEYGWSAGAGVAFLQAYNRNTSLFKDLLFNNSLTIKDNGNVGVGSASPGYKLTTHLATTTTGDVQSWGNTTNGTYGYVGIASAEFRIFGAGSTALVLGANNAEVMRLSPAGNVSIGQGGIALGGNTDVLDAYDLGNWTPIIVDSSFSGAEGVTYSIQVGTFTQVGDEIHIQGHIVLTSIGTLTAGDPVYIAGLPAAAENVSSSRSGISIHAATGLNLGAAGQCVTGRILENTSYIDLQVWDTAAGTTSMLVSELSATGDIVFSGSYKV